MIDPKAEIAALTASRNMWRTIAEDQLNENKRQVTDLVGRIEAAEGEAVGYRVACEELKLDLVTATSLLRRIRGFVDTYVDAGHLLRRDVEQWLREVDSLLARQKEATTRSSPGRRWPR